MAHNSWIHEVLFFYCQLHTFLRAEIVEDETHTNQMHR